MNELEKIRQNIDAIDNQLMELLEKRFEMSFQVRDYKKANAIAVLDNKREEFILNKIAQYECDSQIREQIKSVYQTILTTSKAVQK